MCAYACRVRYLGLVRNVVGRAEDELALPTGSSVRQLLDQLVARNGDSFRHSLLTSDGRLRSAAHILVDDADVGELEGLDTILTEGSPVTIMLVVYPVEGG